MPEFFVYPGQIWSLPIYNQETGQEQTLEFKILDVKTLNNADKPLQQHQEITVAMLDTAEIERMDLIALKFATLMSVH